MNRIDLSVLPEKVRQVLEILEKRPLWKDFYLTGRSGLAIQIFHRPSFDLDLFSEKNPLSRSERGKILDSLRPLGRLEIQTNEEGTLRVICEEVGIAFFHYPYPLIKPLVEYKRVRIASLMDIGLMKLSAIVGRGSKKDFIDIYFLLKDHISLDKLLKFAKEKFGEMRDFSILSSPM
jgi:hypothetical protein